MNTRRAIIFFVALTALCGAAKAQHEVVVDQVVAVVGKNIIKLSDIENSYIQIRRKQGYANAKANRCQLLEGMLISKLLVHKGEVDSVEVTDEEVEQQVQYYLKNYIRQYGSKEAMYQATGHTYYDLHDIYFDLLKDKLLSQRVVYNLTENVKVNSRMVVKGDVHLVLCDGAELDAGGNGGTMGISVTEGNSLTIYSQTGNTGKLLASSNEVNWYAGIGGDAPDDNTFPYLVQNKNAGNITIHGGEIITKGSHGSAAIGMVSVSVFMLTSRARILGCSHLML